MDLYSSQLFDQPTSMNDRFLSNHITLDWLFVARKSILIVILILRDAEDYKKQKQYDPKEMDQKDGKNPELLPSSIIRLKLTTKSNSSSRKTESMMKKAPHKHRKTKNRDYFEYHKKRLFDYDRQKHEKVYCKMINIL